MDLTLDDIGEFLNVPPQTIKKWVKNKAIPHYEIDGEIRFDAFEIEKWILQREENAETLPAQHLQGYQQFILYRALHNGLILANIPGTTKEQVITVSVASIAPRLKLDAEVVTELLLDREKLMSTAIGYGFALPHAREIIREGITDFVALAFLDIPIEYEALDHNPVDTLFFLFASHKKRHLHLLSKIALLIGSEENRAFLKQRPSKEILLPWILRWEGSLVKPC
jgi:PTS system nitrogen regulatory IIA component